jgi:YjbE family integral membrane protein
VIFSDFHNGSVNVPRAAWCENMELTEISFAAALLQIMLVNIVLSGDNAVVIALAARGLSPRHQRMAIFLGGAGAIVLRILLTIVAVRLLGVPFLQFFGGILLVWIAVQLLIVNDEGEGGHSAQSNLWGAVKTILVADAVMSLDNTLAIAALAKGNWTLLLAGLALSIPLIVAGSTIIMKIMDRFPVIVYVGAGLIAWTAGEMIDSDEAIQPYLPSALPGTIYLPILLTLVVVGYGWRHNLMARRTAHDVLEADVHIAQQMEKELTDHPAK